jgi:hypothetical protein
MHRNGFDNNLFRIVKRSLALVVVIVLAIMAFDLLIILMAFLGALPVLGLIAAVGVAVGVYLAKRRRLRQ